MRERSSSSSTTSDGSPRRLFAGLPVDADDVAEVDVDLAGARGRAQQLDAAGAVDEVEEDELPHVAPRHHAPGEAPRLGGLRPVLERLRLGAHGGDLVAVRIALRRAFAHGRLTIAQACGPSFGVSPSRTVRKPWRLVEREVVLVVRQQDGRTPSRSDAAMPGASSAPPIPWRRAAGSTPMPARYQCGPAGRLDAQRFDRAAVREELRRRRAEPQRRRHERAQRRADAHRRAARRKPARGAEHRPSRRVDLRRGDVEADPEEPRQKPRAALRVRQQPHPRGVVEERPREDGACFVEARTLQPHDLHRGWSLRT